MLGARLFSGVKFHSWTRSAVRYLRMGGREHPHVQPPAGDAETLLALADQLRDRKEFSSAALAYGEVVRLVPGRYDLHVQYGNMLKDSGDRKSVV